MVTQDLHMRQLMPRSI